MAKTTTQPKYLVEAKGPEIEDSLKEMLDRRMNKYLLVNLIAHRARDLNRGDRALVDLPEPHTNTELAMAEVENNKLNLLRKQKSKVLVSLIKND